MPSACVINKSLSTIDSSSEETCRSHPCRCKFDAILRRYHHSKSRIRSFDFDIVWGAIELKRVISGLIGILVFLRVIAKGECCNTTGLHYILLDVLCVRHPCYLFDYSTQEHIADVAVILLPSWPFRQNSIVDDPLQELFLVKLA